MKKLIIILTALFVLIAASFAVNAEYSGEATKPGDAYAGSQRLYSLPTIHTEQGDSMRCGTEISVQNLNTVPVKAVLIVWGEAGFCAPQSAGPLKVECTGLLPPGATWTFKGDQIPADSVSGMVLVSADGIMENTDISQDVMCENLFSGVVRDSNDYRRFMLGYGNSYYSPWGLYWKGQYKLGVAVNTGCGDDGSSSYSAIESEVLSGSTFSTLVPWAYGDSNDKSSIISIQNIGLQCTSVEVALKQKDDCLRNNVCEVINLAPGETSSFDVSACAGSDWQGSAWLRSTQPLGVVVDTYDINKLSTYEVGTAGNEFKSNTLIGGSLSSNMHAWDTNLYISALESTYVKVIFFDGNGQQIANAVDWICAGGTQEFELDEIHNFPGNAPIQYIAYSLDEKDIIGVAQIDNEAEAAAFRLFNYEDVFGAGKYLSATSVSKTTGMFIASPRIKPKTTGCDILLYDQNGYLGGVWEYLGEKSAEYINFMEWRYINPGYAGSALFECNEGIYGYVYGRPGLSTVATNPNGCDHLSVTQMGMYTADIGPAIGGPSIFGI